MGLPSLVSEAAGLLGTVACSLSVQLHAPLPRARIVAATQCNTHHLFRSACVNCVSMLNCHWLGLGCRRSIGNCRWQSSRICRTSSHCSTVLWRRG